MGRASWPPKAGKLADLVASGDLTAMIIVYVIQNIGKTYRYVGMTKNIKDRVDRHNSDRNFSTKNKGPFEIIHTEEFENYKLAREREKFLKSGVGRKFLDTLRS